MFLLGKDCQTVCREGSDGPSWTDLPKGRVRQFVYVDDC
jgi:hypothetical protein